MTTSPDRWATVERLYHAALARPVDERAAFLAESCADDEELRREVQSLLTQASAGGGLTGGAVAAAAGLVTDVGHSVLAGRRLGAYQILAPLGAGGMGEVYRARDTRLGRDVAIKILPRAFTADASRLARFEREARVLASLNHPHIAAIYGFEEGKALILELVEGETLAERITRAGSTRGLPIKEALDIARQIADALDAAHEKGIVHRDLKPANIKITPQGVVKVLDFGLAKLEAAAAGEAGGDVVSEAPTITVNDTREGLIVGTAAYMSPEQARGQAVDKRTDIWAFGCVLYEMLTGRRAFAAATATETLAVILERDADWTKLPSSTPSHMRTVLRRTLNKDPRRRLHDIADVRIELEDEAAAHAALPNADPRRGLHAKLVWASAGIVAIVGFALAGWYLRGALPSAPVPGAVTRLVVAPEAPLAVGSEGMVAISPDGRRIAYVATADGRQQIYLRDLTQFEGKPLAGTEDGDSPAFAPDGQWLAFLADRRVKKISVAGGTPITLFEFAEGLGLSWDSNDGILFSPGRATGIWRVSATGGKPTPVTTLHDGESSHRDPQSLPGSRALLYSALSGSNNVQVFAQSIETGQRHAIDRGAGARYLPTGHVVYTKDGTLFAVPFDPVRLEATGSPVPVIEGVRQTPIGTPQTAFAQTGSMVYVASAAQQQDETELVWISRSGAEEPTSISGVGFQMPRVSPDGSRVIVAASRGGTASIGTVGDLWMYDLTRNTRSRLTFNGASSFPIWAPDGTRLAYSSGQTGQFQIHLKPFGVGTSEELLSSDRGTNYPLSWSRDGRYLASVSVDTKTFNDIWVADVSDHPTWRPFVQTPFREGAPTFSHDGRWIAYASEQSGRSEIYMRPFPGPGEEWTISPDGGTEPLWAKTAGQLFYLHGNEMMVVDINTGPPVTASRPRRLFEKPYTRSSGFWPNYDVAGDGQRFLMVKGKAEEAPPHINVVLNWQEELKQRVPTR